MRAGAEPAFFLPYARPQTPPNPKDPIERMRKEVEELWSIVEPPVRGAGLDLVELEFNREAEGWVLRVYIDRPWTQGDPVDETAVTFEHCELVSRDVSAALDVADVVTHKYRLEVSSPGLDRPLRRPVDFQRFAGREVKVRTTDMVEGRRNFSGTIRGAKEGVVEVDCDGRTYQLPVQAIARAHLVPDWDAEFRRGGSGRGEPDGDRPNREGEPGPGAPRHPPYRSAS
jgi:ribosome maturation factor RimP